MCFPFLRTRDGDGSTCAHHMRDARFTTPTPAPLARVVDTIDRVPVEDRDTKGDLYGYMLGKIATAGQNGQFRTPRHIIQLMVAMTAPGPGDVVVDPACGTCDFLAAAGEYVRAYHGRSLMARPGREHFHHEMFHGFDGTMLRIGSVNMLLHGVENPDIRYRCRPARSGRMRGCPRRSCCSPARTAVGRTECGSTTLRRRGRACLTLFASNWNGLLLCGDAFVVIADYALRFVLGETARPRNTSIA